MALTAKQIEERQNYIGGSDVGAILGYNKYESALDIFNKKVDGTSKVISNPQIYWGNVLEPVIINELDSILRHYTDMWIHDNPGLKKHKDYDFLAGNVDGLICTNPLSTKKAILEIKTVSSYQMRKFWGEENHDLDCLKYRVGADKSSGLKADFGEIPPSYYYQCAFYMYIYNIDLTYIAVYFGNDMPFKVYKIERDLELEKIMAEELVDFWQNNVLKGIPPAPRSLTDIIRLYPHGTPDKTVIASPEITEISYKYKDAKLREKEAKEEAKELKMDIKKFMGDAEFLFDVGGNKLHKWSRFKKKKFQYKLLKEKDPKTYEKYLTEIDSEMLI